MEVAIPERQEKFIKQVLSEGRFASENEVVLEGLRLLEQNENQRKLGALRTIVQESLKDTREVSNVEMDEAIDQKSRELLAQGIPW